MKSKYLLIINLSGSLGGAEIRYLNLFKEILTRNADYNLIINRKLYELAIKGGYLKSGEKNIYILEIDNLGFNNTKKSKIIDTLKKNKINFKHLRKQRNSLLSIKQLITYSFKLHQLFKKNKPEYVYTVWVGGMIAWPLKYYYKFKMVYSYMDSGFSSLESFIGQSLKSERLPLKNADIIDFLSADLYKGVKEIVSLKEKIKISISPCSFKNYETLIPKYPKQNTIVFCSRMTPIKNPLLLLESISLFNKQFTDWETIKFQFLGDGECLEEMKNYTIFNKLYNVELLGHVNSPDKYFQRSKIFISIQQTNNYPSQSLLEAMACENAIIASDVGETRKLVTEKEGILVKLDAQEIALALIYLLNNAEKSITFGKNARKKVLTEHNIENYLKYFYSLENL